MAAPDPAQPTDPPVPPALGLSTRKRLAILGTGALIAVGACALLWLDVSARDSWGCTSPVVPTGLQAPTARGALERYLQGSDFPQDGWQPEEENRFAAVQGPTQYVVGVNQVSDSVWEVVTASRCGPNG